MGVIERKYKCASYPYTEKETMWAFAKFTDANGPVMKFEEGMFRKCSCVNNEGDRKPCVPPLPGFMCQRICTKVKTKNVLYADRQQRIWTEYKTNNLKDAVQRAKEEVSRPHSISSLPSSYSFRSNPFPPLLIFLLNVLIILLLIQIPILFLLPILYPWTGHGLPKISRRKGLGNHLCL